MAGFAGAAATGFAGGAGVGTDAGAAGGVGFAADGAVWETSPSGEIPLGATSAAGASAPGPAGGAVGR
ncbi:hypothetical protein [Frankia sp. ArI3]|uniref:hypothetical protein n=1 Tax=Frankia sp. ArI3 TaxID=1858 RepID=UPI002103C1E8|nr:hypothetical protein [Frankia sp. ArI3]